jgi:ubiquitin-like modifier-activating enzyme ATG7
VRVVSIIEKLVLLTAKWIAPCLVCLYRLLAPADKEASVLENTEHPLGILPHQVRGFVAHFAQLVVMGHAFNKCTACSSIVVMEFRERGMEFVLEVLNRPNYLEDLTGLTELLSATHSMSLEWDDDTEEADDLEL